jgi:hypothetical protein
MNSNDFSYGSSDEKQRQLLRQVATTINETTIRIQITHHICLCLITDNRRQNGLPIYKRENKELLGKSMQRCHSLPSVAQWLFVTVHKSLEKLVQNGSILGFLYQKLFNENINNC